MTWNVMRIIKKLAPPAIAAYGGKYVARGGKAEKLEGNWEPGRVIILEFESVEKAKQFIDSPEYREARALRHTKRLHQKLL